MNPAGDSSEDLFSLYNPLQAPAHGLLILPARPFAFCSFLPAPARALWLAKKEPPLRSCFAAALSAFLLHRRRGSAT